jgi:cation diffusion facilitator family transporter
MVDEKSCSCGAEIPTHATAVYRRALWLVAALNLAMGVVELVFGYVAGSQALKADALDFLGDGAITGLGLVAMNWGADPRARAALVQGVFLALMGLGVFAVTVYRVFVIQVPEAGLMGSLGLMALIVNVACAAILLRHRDGDANVRAVWLFSRNDAIGNAAVIVAALAIAATGSSWPDLITAAAIAGLFVHSAVRIISDALGELDTTSPAHGNVLDDDTP